MLTTVSFIPPQAQTSAGATEDNSSAAHAIIMATSQNIRNPLFNFMSFTSQDISF